MSIKELKLTNFTIEEVDNIVILTNNRPDAMNALSDESWDDIDKTAEFLRHYDKARVLIITAEGTKSFAAGADIVELKSRSPVDHLNSKFIGLNKLKDLRIPTIAAVNGYAFGGGFELALSCDIRIASTNALFGLPEPDLGLIPGLGGTQKLVRIAGGGVTKNIVLGGQRLTAEDAVNANICISSTEPENLMEEAMKLAKRITRKGPLALQIAKKSIEAAHNTDLEFGLFIESLGFSVLLSSDDHMEGLDAFLEKRAANFKGK